MDITALIDERIRRALRALRLPFRARLTQLNGDPALQLAQGQGLAGEQAQAVEVVQQFGFSSGIPEGSQLIVLPLAGKSSANVVIATEHGAYRLKVGPGEARMYSQEGAYVHIKQGRVIEAECDDFRLRVKNAAVIEAGQGVLIDTPQTTLTGNMTATGEKGDKVEMSANVAIQGNITQDGSIVSSGDHVAGGISQTGHTHTGVLPGGGNTGLPQ
ncbi:MULTISPECIES: phage baseplate assembly protein V [unclassified Desulfovibrio]|uniref:phage baseplate assembly protein V n=1 Tax=unclassified Desulfovibrio TaxID=2593640 RepID=UPI0013EC3DBE|nr:MULTISPECIES: phage baseplate assembly protein V [unclassified Desulfovibrio]